MPFLWTSYDHSCELKILEIFNNPKNSEIHLNPYMSVSVDYNAKGFVDDEKVYQLERGVQQW